MAASSARSAFLLSYVEDEREMYGGALWAARFLVTVFLDLFSRSSRRCCAILMCSLRISFSRARQLTASS